MYRKALGKIPHYLNTTKEIKMDLFIFDNGAQNKLKNEDGFYCKI